MENSSCFCVLERLRTSVAKKQRSNRRLLVRSVITMESHSTLSTSGDYRDYRDCHNNKQLRERSPGVRTQETEYRHLPL